MLVTLSEILKDANERHYAVGAFNCLSLENVMGALQAAEELRAPIILQLAEVQFPEAPLDMMAPLYLHAAHKASVPVCVHLDHGQSLETCVRAIRLGFTSVMFDGAALPFDENVAVTSEVARIAKAAGVDVIVDDRDERPGVKFKDADLIGFPVRVVVGMKGLSAGGVEIKRRSEDKSKTRVVPPGEAAAAVKELLK